MKFIVDDMLGRLAKWLRILGYDTLYFKHIEDKELVRKAKEEGRVILTRDRSLIERKLVRNRPHLLISEDKFERQLKQVIKELNLDFQRRLFTRCCECNAELSRIPKKAVKERVPFYVYQTQDDFYSCPGCQRIYWQGSHWDRVMEKIKEVMTIH